MACSLVRPSRPPLSLLSESFCTSLFFAQWPSLLLVVPRPPLPFVVSVLCPRLRRRRPLEALLSGGRVMAVGAGLCAAVMVMLLCVMT